MITKPTNSFLSLLLARIFNLCEIYYLFLLSLLATVVLCVAQQNALVDLGYAQYQGNINNQIGNVKFLGI